MAACDDRYAEGCRLRMEAIRWPLPARCGELCRWRRRMYQRVPAHTAAHMRFVHSRPEGCIGQQFGASGGVGQQLVQQW